MFAFCFLLQIYRILGKTVVCYPIIFDLSDFYMSQDVLLLIDDIKVALSRGDLVHTGFWQVSLDGGFLGVHDARLHQVEIENK